MRGRLVVTASTADYAARWPRCSGHGTPVAVTLWLPGLTCSIFVGRIVVCCATGFVASAEIEPRFRGLRLARKLYGEAAKVAGILLRDPYCSPEAQRVWDSIIRSPSWRHATTTGYWPHRAAVFARPAWHVRPSDLAVSGS